MTPGNLLPLCLLAVYGAAFASTALGLSTIAFDDHPGQLYRVWHVVTHGPAPWAWNAGWWAGYPELQFYPPGASYAAALFHLASWGRMSVAASYQTLVWVAYLGPALTVWLALRRVLGDGWLALPGAFVALTLSAGLTSGVVGGVYIGMIAARLGWALLPLLVFVLVPWTSGRTRFPWTVVPLVAAVVITHPAHLPAAVVLVGLAATFAGPPVRRPFAHAIAALLLAAGLTAFWAVPLLAHAAHTRALAWGAIAWREIVGDPLLMGLVVLAAVDAVVRWRRRSTTAPDDAFLSAFPWAMVAVVLVDALVLERLGLRWLPADRVADSAWLGFVLSAGAVVGRVIGAVVTRPRRRAALAVVAVAVAIGVAPRGQTLILWPAPAEWARLDAIGRGMRLEALWATLRAAPAGRVLFVRSSVPLGYGPGHWHLHSHVTSLTPMTTGRAIINGTFTHASPVAALFYRGDAGPGAIRELVERLDGRRLLGRDLEALDAETFNRFADRLGISAVVALDEDLPRLRALRDNAEFSRAAPSAPFVVFMRRSPVELPVDVGPGRLRMSTDAAVGAWVPTGIAYYPLWRASSAGRPVPTRRGALGDLEIQVTDARPVDLLYRRGAAETAGVVVTAVSLAGLGVAWATARRAARDR